MRDSLDDYMDDVSRWNDLPREKCVEQAWRLLRKDWPGGVPDDAAIGKPLAVQPAREQP